MQVKYWEVVAIVVADEQESEILGGKGMFSNGMFQRIVDSCLSDALHRYNDEEECLRNGPTIGELA